MIKNTIQLVLFIMLIQLSACSEDGPSDSDVKSEMLSAQAWGHPTVMHGTDGDLSDQYADFAITFTRKSADGFLGTYFVANGSHAFADVSGKWKFNDDLTMIILDSGRELDFQLDESHLTLDFIVPESGGRSNGLSGHFTFNLQAL
jgi:hypothetical protein